MVYRSYTLSACSHCRTYLDERKQSPGEDLPPLLLAHRCPVRGSQPVGSFVTKTSPEKPPLPLKVGSKAPGVVG